MRHAQAAAELAAAAGAHLQAGGAVCEGAARSGGLPAPERASLHLLRAEALYAADDQVGSIAGIYEALPSTTRKAMSLARPARWSG